MKNITIILSLNHLGHPVILGYLRGEYDVNEVAEMCQLSKDVVGSLWWCQTICVL